jgi:putative transcriptional regulator
VSRWWERSPRAGSLIVATPALGDAQFRRTVVYLIEHGAEGSVGVILNRPSRTPVGAVLADWHEVMSEPSVLHEGGPVQRDGALCLARLRPDRARDPGVRPTVGGIALVDLDADVPVVAAQVSALRVFAGHAGWSEGQLEGEIAGGSWYVVRSEPGDLFSSEPAAMWRRVLRRQPSPLSWVATFPDDPTHN